MECIAQIVSFLLSIIVFLIGGIIYLAFRSETLLMFTWAKFLRLDVQIDWLRNIMRPYIPTSDWVLYSLPDGLWVLSYVIMMSALWRFEIKEHYILIGLIPCIAIGSELLQAIGIMPGTFDMIDLLTYLGFSLLGILYSLIIKDILL